MQARAAWLTAWLGLALCSGVACSSDNSGGSAGDYCGTLLGRERSCGYLGAGQTNCVDYSDQAEPCETACVARATCASIGAWMCTGATSDLSICMARCVGLEPVTCADGSVLGGYYRCNGSADCTPTDPTTSADELGCTATGYKCRSANQYVPSTAFCDGHPDCSDGSDETPDCAVAKSCTLMTTSAQGTITNNQICNGVTDCADGSDEASCAPRMCPVAGPG